MQVPTQVYELPVTGNMEYGFFAGSMAGKLRGDPRFQHCNNQSDVSACGRHLRRIRASRVPPA